MRQALDDRLMDERTMGELSLGRPLDRGGCLILYSFLQLFRDFDFWPLNGDPTVYVLFPVEQYQGPSTPINNEIGEGRGDKNDDQNQRKLALAMKYALLSADTLF